MIAPTPVTSLPVAIRITRACSELGISRATLYRLIQAGKLTHVRVGAKAAAVTRESLLKLLAEGQEG